MPKNLPESAFRQKRIWILFVFIIVIFGIRMFFALQTHEFSDDDSYFTLRQAQHIKDTFVPEYNDNLSYGGRTNIFTPLFHYLVGIPSFLIPMWLWGKILTNLLGISMILIVYLISYHISKNFYGAIISSIMAGIAPILFKTTLNTLSATALAVPLIFFAMYSLMRIQDPKFFYYYIICIIALSLTNQSVLLILLGLFIYLIIILLENMKQSKLEWEALLFSFLFTLWFLLIVFKKVLLFHGSAALWQNVPEVLLFLYFQKITLIDAINRIGIFPTFYGVYATYIFLFERKQREIYLLIGFSIAIVGVLYLKLIEFNFGLLLVAMLFSIMYAPLHVRKIKFFKHSIFERFLPYYMASFVIVILLTSGILSINLANAEIKNSLSASEVDALLWIKENTNENDVILASLFEGNYITYYAKRKNVMDTNFLMIPDINTRLNEVSMVYLNTLETPILEITDKYGINYIYFSDRAKSLYGTRRLKFYSPESKCFDMVYRGDVKIVKVLCNLETIRAVES